MLEIPGVVDAFVGSPTVLYLDGEHAVSTERVREVMANFKVKVEALEEDATHLL